ncbi:MAG: hypothetical protein ACO2XQ_02170 [Flavobacteriales bacterium]|jgi:hypothetical protein
MNQEQILRVNKIAEFFWLLIILCCVIATSYFIWRDGWEQQKQTVVLPLLAAAWYGFRRFFRKKLERGSAGQND